MTIETTEGRPLQPANAPQYPNAEDIFLGVEGLDPILAATYSAYTTTSPLIKRDPGILATIAFADQIANGMSPDEARREFVKATERLTPYFRKAGLRVTREKRPKKDELVYLDLLEPPQVEFEETQETIEDHLAAITFKEPASFPSSDKVREIINTTTQENSWWRTVVDRLHEDFENRRPTLDVAIGRALVGDKTLDSYEAKDVASPQIRNVRGAIAPHGITVARLTSPDYVDRSNVYYTFVDMPEDGKTPSGKYNPDDAKTITVTRLIERPTTRRNHANGASERSKTPREDVRFIEFSDPDNKVIPLEDIEFLEGTNSLTEVQMQEVLNHFDPDSRNHAVLQAIITATMSGQLAFIRPAVREAFADMETSRGLMNFSATVTHLNGILERRRTQIASIRIQAKRNESGMFYTLVQVEPGTHPDPKQVMQLKNTTNGNGIPQELEKTARQLEPHINSSALHEKPTDITTATDRSYDNVPQATLVPAHERPMYEYLDERDITVLTRLFGSNGGSAVTINSLFEHVHPGKSRNNKNLRSFVRHLRRITDGMDEDPFVRITDASPESSNIFSRQFMLQRPAEWNISDVLSYVNALRAEGRTFTEAVQEPSNVTEVIPNTHEGLASTTPTSTGETLLEEGIEASLDADELAQKEELVGTPALQDISDAVELPDNSPNCTPTSEPTLDVPYPNLSRRNIDLLTSLFGNGDGRTISTRQIAGDIYPGRKIKSTQEQNVAIMIGALGIEKLNGLPITVTGNVRAGFTIDYPEGWTLDDLLSAIDGNTPTPVKRDSSTPIAQIPAVETHASENGTRPAPAPTPLNPDRTMPLEDAMKLIRNSGENGHSDLPVIFVDPQTFTWEFQGKSGKIPFAEIIHVLGRLSESKDGIDRNSLTKGLPNGERSFTSLQRMFDNPNSPEIFVKKGGARFTRFHMNARVEIRNN